MRKYLPFVFLVLTVCVLAACQASPIASTPQAGDSQAAAAVVKANTPDQGKITLVGKVISKKNGEPVSNVPVRLAEVYYEGDEGAYVLDGAFSPGDVTDENGDYLIENVDAKGYVIIVGDVMDQYEVIVSEDGKPRVWSFPTDEVFDVPVLTVNLTSP
jgi:hypothetical protein